MMGVVVSHVAEGSPLTQQPSGGATSPEVGVSLAVLDRGTLHCVSLGVPLQPSVAGHVLGQQDSMSPRGWGRGPAAVTHFWTAYLFSSVPPHRVAAWGPGVGPYPAPGDHPTMPGSPGNPRGSPVPAWSFGRAAGRGGSESHRHGSRSFPRWAGGTQEP